MCHFQAILSEADLQLGVFIVILLQSFKREVTNTAEPGAFCCCAFWATQDLPARLINMSAAVTDINSWTEGVFDKHWPVFLPAHHQELPKGNLQSFPPISGLIPCAVWERSGSTCLICAFLCVGVETVVQPLVWLKLCSG